MENDPKLNVYLFHRNLYTNTRRNKWIILRWYLYLNYYYYLNDLFADISYSLDQNLRDRFWPIILYRARGGKVLYHEQVCNKRNVYCNNKEMILIATVNLLLHWTSEKERKEGREEERERERENRKKQKCTIAIIKCIG